LENPPFGAPNIFSWGLAPPLEVGGGAWFLLLTFLLSIIPPLKVVGGAASSPPLEVGGGDGGGFWGLQRKVVQLLVWMLHLVVVLVVAFGQWCGHWFGCRDI